MKRLPHVWKRLTPMASGCEHCGLIYNTANDLLRQGECPVRLRQSLNEVSQELAPFCTFFVEWDKVPRASDQIVKAPFGSAVLTADNFRRAQAALKKVE